MYGASDGNTEKTETRTKNSAGSRQNTIVLCKTCFQEIGRGKAHPCVKRDDRSPAAVSKNIMAQVHSLPEKEQEKIASSIIQRKIKSESVCAKIKNINLKLSSSGTECRVLVNANIKPAPVFSFERLDNLQVNAGASCKQMKKIVNFIRCTAGKKSVPAYHPRHMGENLKSLLDLYKHGTFEFDVDNSPAKQKRPVVWANAEELVEAVIDKRNLTGYYIIKLMADGGRGFFKVSMTILPSTNEMEYESLECEENVSTRRTYAEGGTIGKKANITSVQRLIMLCTVPNIKETYENLKVLFDLTQINAIPFRFVADFKLLLIVNGQQTATSMYPCPYCFVSLEKLRTLKDELEPSNEMAGTNDDSSSKLKTYRDLKKDYDSFCTQGKQKKLARLTHSTIHAPLLEEEDDIPIIEKCIPPELHLLQGFVNHLFWSGLVPVFGREKSLIWPKKLNLVAKTYHGEIFEGNACRRLLKEADRLDDVEIYGKLGHFRIVPFISAFKAMNELVTKCFRVQRADCDIDELINNLRRAVMSTEVSMTLKLHVILTHLQESLKFLSPEHGLGLWSEQAGESIHHEFMKHWDRYKINMIDDPSYSEKLKKAVAEFSSLHI